MHLHVVLHIVLTYLFVEIQILGPADLKSMKLVTNIKLSMSQCVFTSIVILKRFYPENHIYFSKIHWFWASTKKKSWKSWFSTFRLWKSQANVLEVPIFCALIIRLQVPILNQITNKWMCVILFQLWFNLWTKQKS